MTYSDRENNFGALRLVAAVMVILGHSFDLLGLNQLEPLHVLSRGAIASHSLAVDVFFVISGFLVTQSWIARSSLRSYVIARFLRIMPALAVVVILTALVLGPLITADSKPAYLTNPATYSYVSSNLTFFFNQQAALPGVFDHLPYGLAVNGSLWTLPFEVACYGLVVVAGVLGIRRHPRVVSLVWILGILLTLLPIHTWLGSAVAKNPVLFSLPMLFALGAASYCWGLGRCAKKWLRLRVAGIAWVAFLVLAPTELGQFFLLLIVPYTVLTLAYANLGPTIRGVGPKQDLSYGTYLYAFPIQQLVIAVLLGLGGPWAVFLISVPCTLACAACSWRFVEAPALRLKARLLRSAQLPANGSSGS